MQGLETAAEVKQRKSDLNQLRALCPPAGYRFSVAKLKGYPDLAVFDSSELARLDQLGRCGYFGSRRCAVEGDSSAYTAWQACGGQAGAQTVPSRTCKA